MELRDQLQHAVGDAYAIERELAAGGMSRVFLAREAALGRTVVVKVLPPDHAAEISVERFRREARVTAGLQHPHLVPVLAAGGGSGLLYYTMPFVEGESLRDRLVRDKQLSIVEAVRLAREIAEALAYAHGRGVVHRDVKPENILLSDGHAMLTDFGIAKALESAQGGTLTGTGVSLGTPQYMAPEQAAADQLVDGRADIYALGCVLYEMIAGEPPFSGPTAQAVVAKHMAAPFPQVRHGRPDAPAAIDDVIRRATAKAPSDRYASAAEFASGLAEASLATPAVSGVDSSRPRRGRSPRRAPAIAAAVIVAAALLAWAARGLVRAPASAGLESVAVLPFANLSGDTSYDYFAEGMSDQLRSDLTSLRSLKVMGRASSTQFRGRGVDVKAAGAKLGVGAVVAGAVNRSGSQLHVTAELVRVADGTALASMTFDRHVNDVAAIQDTIERAIEAKLAAGFASATSTAGDHRFSRGTANFDAYDLFLKGAFTEDHHDYPHAIALFQAAIDKDPNFVRAYASMASTYLRQPLTGFGSRDSAIVHARELVTKALSIGASRSDLLVAQAGLKAADWDFPSADSLAALAVAADPGDSERHAFRSITLSLLGDMVGALSESRRALELDPLNEERVTLVQGYLYWAGDYRGAIRETERLVAMNPSSTTLLIVYPAAGLAYDFLGKPDSAITEFERALEIDAKRYGGRAYVVFGYAAAGRWGEARRQRALLERDSGGNSPNFQLSYVHLAFSRPDSAMIDLERAAAAKEPLFILDDVPCNPVFDPLKRDPRFSALMRRLGARACPPRDYWPIRSAPAE